MNLEELWDRIRKWFFSLGNDVVDFLEPLAEQIVKSGGTVLMQLALEAVKIAEEQGGSGAEKFDAAKKFVITGLQQQGIAVVTNAIHAAIEASVAKMNANP